MSAAPAALPLILGLAALTLACGARPAAEEPAPADSSAAMTATAAPRPVAVADLEGDADRAFKQRLLRAMRARAKARPILAVETAIRTAHIEDPIASMRHGHARARALLAQTGAIAILWGRIARDAPADAPANAPADTPVLYVTTADTVHGACTGDRQGSPARRAPCRLDTGATWALCASDWSWLWPACAAP